MIYLEIANVGGGISHNTSGKPRRYICFLIFGDELCFTARRL